MLTNSIDGALTFQQLRSAKHFLSVDEKFVWHWYYCWCISPMLIIVCSSCTSQLAVLSNPNVNAEDQIVLEHVHNYFVIVILEFCLQYRYVIGYSGWLVSFWIKICSDLCGSIKTQNQAVSRVMCSCQDGTDFYGTGLGADWGPWWASETAYFCRLLPDHKEVIDVWQLIFSHPPCASSNKIFHWVRHHKFLSLHWTST